MERQSRSRRRKSDYGLRRDARGIWHADFYVAGKRVQRSTYTADKAKAEEWCASEASGLWRERKLGEAPPLKWEQAVALWVKAKELNGKRDLANDMDKARLLSAKLAGKMIHTLSVQDCDGALDAMAEDRGMSNATRNRYRSFLTGVLNYARSKGYGAPTLRLEKRKEADGRVRWLTKEEAAKLLSALAVHLRRMVEFSLATGLRQANVSGLKWQNVDLERRVAWVVAGEAKGRKNISIPLSETALRVLMEAKECPQHASRTFCFTYYGQPLEAPGQTGFHAALTRAGIADFRWHDLRHTWATWHVMGWMSKDGRPTPLNVLQKLGGWGSMTMLQRYAHLASDFTAQYVGDVMLPTTVAASCREAGSGVGLEPAESGSESRR